MSTSDRKRTKRHVGVMSALPLKADMCSATAHVCFGPQADILILRAKAYFFLSAVIRSDSIQPSFTGKLLNLLGVDMC